MLIDRVPRRLRTARVISGARKARTRVLGAEVATRARAAERDLRRLPAEAGASDLVVARARRHAYLGRVVERASTQDARERNLRLAVERLESVGVPYFLMSARPGARAVVGVAVADRRRAITALDQLLGADVCYLARVNRERVAHEVRAGRGGGRSLASAEVVRFFEATSSAGGVLLTGPDEGCDIEFWSPAGDVLVAPRKNQYATDLRPEDREPVESDLVGGESGRTYATHPPFLVDHAFDVAFPIDAVYTWVDGDDPAWRARKEAAMRADGQEIHNDLAANSSRYTSRDELKYSLRSHFRSPPRG